MTKIMLRRTDNGKLTEHHFIDRQHACDWLKKDTTNEERFTVCLVEQAEHAQEFMEGQFHSTHSEVMEEMTVSQFIGESLVMKDKKHDKKATA